MTITFEVIANDALKFFILLILSKFKSWAGLRGLQSDEEAPLAPPVIFQK